MYALIPEYKEYAGETKIALMDNSSLAFMHELSQRSYPSDGILSVYDLILIPKWVMEEIEDSTCVNGDSDRKDCS